MSDKFREKEDLGSALTRLDIELDQKLKDAFIQASYTPSTLFDSTIFHALNRLNMISTRLLDIDKAAAKLPDWHGTLESPIHNADIGRVYLEDRIIIAVLNRALSERTDKRVIGTRDFLSAVVALSLENDANWGSRPRSADLLTVLFGGDERGLLSTNFEARRILQELLSAEKTPEDYQFALAFEDDRIVFRVISTLGDFVERSESGLLVPRRALLTHHNTTFGSFTPDQILELEELVNNPSTREADLQDFFELNPHFFRRWDFRQIHPHVFLTRDDDGPLIPDFILTDADLQRATIVDLKMPSSHITRRQRNRHRFSASIAEAKAQLLEYRDWFEDIRNRERMRDRLGMTIYRPRIAVIVGRSQEFLDEVDRARLTSRETDIEIVTYDDMLAYARRRRLYLE